MARANEIKYLTAIKQEKRPKKFCRFKKYGIKYIDYKDVEFLKKFLNEQGKMLPRKTVAVIDVRAGKKMDKVKVCHKPGKQLNTLEIGADGVADHLGHGDMLGSCSDATLMVSNRLIGDKSETEVSAHVLSVVASPNPSTNHFVLSIQGAVNSKLTLKVTDILGRVVEQKNNLQANRSLQIGADYRPGVYFVELIQGSEIKQVKLLKTGN